MSKPATPQNSSRPRLNVQTIGVALIIAAVFSVAVWTGACALGNAAVHLLLTSHCIDKD